MPARRQRSQEGQFYEINIKRQIRSNGSGRYCKIWQYQSSFFKRHFVKTGYLGRFSGTNFSKLKKKEIVKSIRGTQGGYILSKKPSEIKLNNIFDAIDESVKTVQCKKESKKSCNGKSSKCVTHDLWNELETHINSFFEQKSLEDLVSKKESRI